MNRFSLSTVRYGSIDSGTQDNRQFRHVSSSNPESNWDLIPTKDVYCHCTIRAYPLT